MEYNPCHSFTPSLKQHNFMHPAIGKQNIKDEILPFENGHSVFYKPYRASLGKNIVDISGTRYNGGMGNIETLTEVFNIHHKIICDGFNKALVEAKLFPESEIKFKIGKASEFEFGIYLLFRIDTEMCGKQKENIRRALFDSCMYSMLPSNDEWFVSLVDHRMEVYGKIYNDAIEAGEDWAKVVERWHDWLLNAMLYCENDFNKMTTDDMPFVIVGFTQLIPIKLVLTSTEICEIIILLCIFKQVFADNDDFTMLSHEELLERMEAGSKEGLSIVKKNR